MSGETREQRLSFTIEIPCDDVGFALPQCPLFGELFKLKPSDYEADDVVELTLAVAKNKTFEAVPDEMKRLQEYLLFLVPTHSDESVELACVKTSSPPTS